MFVRKYLWEDTKESKKEKGGTCGGKLAGADGEWGRSKKIHCISSYIVLIFVSWSIYCLIEKFSVD